jgi:hypothetical protein
MDYCVYDGWSGDRNAVTRAEPEGPVAGEGHAVDG